MTSAVWRVVGGSKLLLMPMSGLALAATGVVYATYQCARAGTGALLDVQFNKAGTLCQSASTIAGLGAAAVFMTMRQVHHRPMKFSQILRQMEQELVGSTVSVTRTVDSAGRVTLRSTPISPHLPPSVSSQSWGSSMLHRTRLFIRAAKVPVRFHVLNLFAASLLVGSFTSVTQRIACGKTGKKGEVGDMLRIHATIAAAAKEAAEKEEKKKIPTPPRTDTDADNFQYEQTHPASVAAEELAIATLNSNEENQHNDTQSELPQNTPTSTTNETNAETTTDKTNTQPLDAHATEPASQQK